MAIYGVSYTYVRDGRPVSEGEATIIAETREEAQEHFETIHPDGSNFHYDVTGVGLIGLGY